MKQLKLVFCAPLEKFIIQNVSSVPIVNAFWMEFLLLKILKKELIALHAIKSKLYFRIWNELGHGPPDTNLQNSFYRLHSPKCFKCGKPICPEPGEKEALRIIAMDKSFHKACFVCEVSFVRTFKPNRYITWSFEIIVTWPAVILFQHKIYKQHGSKTY